MARTGGFSTMLDAATRRAFNFLRGEVDTLDERVTIIESGGGGDFPEAPLDGQQYGRQSAAWSVIELDDGEHVLTGDPENPPAGLDAGQLLWDGVEGGSGGGDAGPHDHDEYALVEHDHDEYAMAEMSQEVVKFETPGTFEFKKADYPNLSFITVEVVGGGGAGGSALACEANEASVGAGGGSGGYGFRTIKAVDLADVESVVVGAGGTPDSARSVVDVADGAETVAATGGDGEASLAFAINSHGRRGGGTVKTASGDPYLNTLPGGGGGSYGTKDFGVGGGPGTPPFAHTHRSVGGNGGGVMFAVGGGGGNAVTAAGQAGFNGRSGGGGGGGANRAGNNVLHLGGNGGDGVVIVTVFSATGSGSGGGGPHDHDEYLPLTGGTLTGDLTLAGGTLDANGGAHVLSGGNQVLRLMNSAPTSRPYVSVFYNDVRAGFFGNPSASSGGVTELQGEGNTLRLGSQVKVQVQTDLQVDGVTTIHGAKGFFNLSEVVSPPADHWTSYPGVWGMYGMHAGTQGGYMTSMTNNGYRTADNKWKSLGVNGQVGAAQIDLAPTGHFYVRVASNYPTGSASSPPIRFTVTDAGPTFRAQPSKTRSTDEILERAETAEFPPEDDEGVATMDGHDEVPLFEVVTALLAKVKELSAEIEELRGA